MNVRWLKDVWVDQPEGLVVLAQGEEAKKVVERDWQAKEYDVFVLGTMQFAAISDPWNVCCVLTMGMSKPGSHKT